MASHASHGVLVIRVWLEDADDPLRARLSASVDDGPARDVLTTAHPSAVVAAVQLWLDGFTGSARREA